MEVLEGGHNNIEENNPHLMENNTDRTENEVTEGNEEIKDVGEECKNIEKDHFATLIDEGREELQKEESELPNAPEEKHSLTEKATPIIDEEEKPKKDAEERNESTKEEPRLTEGTEAVEGEAEQQKEEVEETDNAAAGRVINEKEPLNTDFTEEVTTETVKAQRQISLNNGNLRENDDQFFKLQSSLEPSDEQIIYDENNLESPHEIAKLQAKDKFKTIRFIPKGNTSKRVALFENMKIM